MAGQKNTDRRITGKVHKGRRSRNNGEEESDDEGPRVDLNRKKGRVIVHNPGYDVEYISYGEKTGYHLCVGDVVYDGARLYDLVFDQMQGAIGDEGVSELVEIVTKAVETLEE